MISSKRINFIRAKLLTYTFRELYPVCSVNNKNKSNSMSFREINMQYDKYIIVEKDTISSPSHNIKYGVDLHHNNLLHSNTLKQKKVLVSHKTIKPRRKSSKDLNLNIKKVDSTLNTCSTLTQSYHSDCIENNYIKLLRNYLHTLKKPKRKVNSNSSALRKYSDTSSYKSTKNKSPTVTYKGRRSAKQCLENIQFTINKNNDIEFHIIDVKPLEREPEVVSSIIKLHRMSDNE